MSSLEALAKGAEDRATLNVFPQWHDHGLEAAQGGFGNRGQQRGFSNLTHVNAKLAQSVLEQCNVV